MGRYEYFCPSCGQKQTIKTGTWESEAPTHAPCSACQQEAAAAEAAKAEAKGRKAG